MTRILFRLSRPLLLIFATLTYVLGAGIARYLGHALSWVGLLLGLLTVLAVLASASLLVDAFRLPLTPLAEGETPRQRERFRILLLQVCYATLALAIASGLALLLTGGLSLLSGALLILAFLFLAAYAVPPLRLSETGYGELLLAFYLAILVPALAFLLQGDEFHRLIAFVGFPLFLLAIAYLLICDFPTFAADQKLRRRTLLVRLTWQRAIPLHHIFVLLAYLLFAMAPFVGIPWSLVWAAFLALPFALVEIVWLQRIAAGGQTLWNFLLPLAAGVFGLTAYLLTMSFWLR
jgi:1,4-dihydroxy-2-naphthoate octaprenyltransferase